MDKSKMEDFEISTAEMWREKVNKAIKAIPTFEKYTSDWFEAVDSAYRQMFDWIWEYEKEEPWGQGIKRIFHDGVTLLREIKWGMNRENVDFNTFISKRMFVKEKMFIIEDILRIENRFLNNEEFDYGWNLYLGCNTLGDIDRPYRLTKVENIDGKVERCMTEDMLDSWKARTEKLLAIAKGELTIKWAQEDLEIIANWKNNHRIYEDSIYDDFRKFTI